jgi:NADH:ubiquinone oxidoreductase subunit 6 (subunit J)
MKTTTNSLPQSPKKTTLVGLGLGCVVPTLILAAAILLGLWLDKALENSKHLYTVGLIIVSVPLTAIALVWSIRAYSSQRTNAKQELDKHRENLQEDADSDAD